MSVKTFKITPINQVPLLEPVVWISEEYGEVWVNMTYNDPRRVQGQDDYFFKFNRINSKDKLIKWLFHLSEKDWFSSFHLQCLLECWDKQRALSMKKIEHRSQGRDFFEMTRSDFFTETASTPNDWLRELRQELDLTMSQIGELVGVNRVQVWKWETGRVTPPKSALISALFLKIIRSIGERDLRLATYPTIRRVKLLAANKDLLQGNKEFLQLQKELRKKEIA